MSTLRAYLEKVVLLVLLPCILPLFVHAQATSASSEQGPDAAVREFRFDDLQASLRTMPAGPERDYFAGILANRLNHVTESIRLLNLAIPSLRASRPDRAAIALQALFDDYNKSFQYAEAAQVDDDLLSHFSNQLNPAQLQSTKDDAGVAHILSGAPPQTITWDGPVRLKTERDPLGDVDTNLTVNGVQGPWLLDTGANISVVSKSFAQRLGLRPLPGVSQTQAGLTGIENPLRVALLPTLQMGGATLHNVVVMVLDDASMNVGFGKHKYQINAVIGYPVFQALGAITFLHDGELVAGDTNPQSQPGAQMYMKGLSPIIECRVEGVDLPFSFDTGANGTVLYERYYNRFRNESGTWIKAKNKTFGAGGDVKRKVYLQPQLNLGIGDKSAVLKRITIYTVGTGTDTDDLYGNLGQDVVANFNSFTLNFKTMTFSLGDPLPPEKAQQTP
jgi:predicted aspartyl protease